jgi:hypothetical protein
MVLVVKERKCYVRKETSSFFLAEETGFVVYIRKQVECQENKCFDCHAELRKCSAFGYAWNSFITELY